MAGSPGDGLVLIDDPDLSMELAGYHLYHATRADLLRRRGDVEGAVAAYGQARARTDNAAERRFIDRRLRTLQGTGRTGPTGPTEGTG